MCNIVNDKEPKCKGITDYYNVQKNTQTVNIHKRPLFREIKL